MVIDNPDFGCLLNARTAVVNQPGKDRGQEVHTAVMPVRA
jgi:hypothetical protein